MNKSRQMSSTKNSDIINFERVNPQFIGIAQRYASHKKNRLQIQKQKMMKTTNFQFLKKMDETLQKDLQKQRQQLQKVRKVRQRYNQGIRHKQEQQQKRRQQIQMLHNKSSEYRAQHKRKIGEAFGTLINDRREKHNQLKKQEQSIRQHKQRQREQRDMENQYKFHLIEYGKEQGQQRVNRYFKFKNKQSLNDYLQRIKRENRKAKHFKSQLKKLQKNLSKFSRKVEKKKEQLQYINSEIMHYTGDSPKLKSRYRNRFQVVSSHSKRQYTPQRRNLQNQMKSQRI